MNSSTEQDLFNPFHAFVLLLRPFSGQDDSVKLLQLLFDGFRGHRSQDWFFLPNTAFTQLLTQFIFDWRLQSRVNERAKK